MVFDNLKNSIHDMNSVVYLRCLNDTDFIFEPTSRARSKYHDTFDNWTKTNEGIYFDNMKSELLPGSAAPKLEYLKLEPLSAQADSAEYEVTYRLTVPHAKPAVPTQVSGNAQFFLNADRFQNWTIRRWIDINDQPDSSWSELKGAFSQ
jgi:hypothetical protein